MQKSILGQKLTWSVRVVLYAKIKCGLVEYAVWLGAGTSSFHHFVTYQLTFHPKMQVSLIAHASN